MHITKLFSKSKIWYFAIQDQVSQLHDSISASEEQIKDLQDKILIHEKSITEKDSLLDDERGKIQRLESDMAEYANCLELKQKRVEELEEISKSTAERNKQLSSTINDLRQNIDEERLIFLKDNSTLMFANEEMANEIQGLRSKLNDAEKHILDQEEKETEIVCLNGKLLLILYTPHL